VANALGIWEETGLRWDASVRDVKRAYASLIKRYRPDSHPQEFSDARLAYENALRIAELRERRRQAEHQSASPSAEPRDAPDGPQTSALSPLQPAATAAPASQATSEQSLALLNAPFSAAPPQSSDQAPVSRPPLQSAPLERPRAIPQPTGQRLRADPLASAPPTTGPRGNIAAFHSSQSRISTAALQTLLGVVDANAEPEDIARAFRAAMQMLRNAPVDDVLEFEELLLERLAASEAPCWPLLISADETFGWRQSVGAQIPSEVLDNCQAAPRVLPVLLSRNRWIRGLLQIKGSLPRFISGRSFVALQKAGQSLRTEASSSTRAALDRQIEASLSWRSLHRLLLVAPDLFTAALFVVFSGIAALGYDLSPALMTVCGVVEWFCILCATSLLRYGWNHQRTQEWRGRVALWIRDHPSFKPPFLVIGALLFGVVAGTIGVQLAATNPILARIMYLCFGMLLAIASAVAVPYVFSVCWRILCSWEVALCAPLDRIEAVQTQIRINQFMMLVSVEQTERPTRYWAVRKQLIERDKQQEKVRAARATPAPKRASGGSFFVTLLFVVFGLSRLIGLMTGDDHQPAPPAPAPQRAAQAAPPLQMSTSTSFPHVEVAPPKAVPISFTISDQFCGRAQTVSTELPDVARREGATGGFTNMALQLGSSGAPGLTNMVTSNAFLIEAAAAIASKMECAANSKRLAYLRLNFRGTPALPSDGSLSAAGHDGWMIIEELRGSKMPPTTAHAMHLAAGWLQADMSSTDLRILDLVNFQPVELQPAVSRAWMKLRGAEQALVLRADGAHPDRASAVRLDTIYMQPRPTRTGTVSACGLPLVLPAVTPEDIKALRVAVYKVATCLKPAVASHQ
jgi:hypothetical protein